MTWFKKTFPAFFKALAKNNTTEWFAENRATYETEVKQPFAAFTREMIDRIAALDPEVKIAPLDAMSRINRDTRFRADKSPYNTHLGCSISRFGRRDREYPGMYFRLSHAGVEVFGGVHAPSPSRLATIRELLVQDGKAFAKAVAAKKFVEHFGELRGDVMKRVPEDLQDAVAKNPYVGMKQLWFHAGLPVGLVTSAELCDVLMAHWRAGREVNEFLRLAFA